MKFLVVGIAIGALAGSAHAQRLEYAGKVTSTPPPIEHHGMFALGDRRYVSVSMLIHDGNEYRLDALDVATGELVAVRMKRATIAHFVKERVITPDVELIALDDSRAGLHVYDNGLAPGAVHHWYIELERKTGTVLRSVELAALPGNRDLYIVGADLARDAMWFYVEHYDQPRGAHFEHARGPEKIVVHRLDLKTLAISDAATIALPARKMKSGYEDRVYVYPARDFSSIAFVEYDEDSFHTVPAARVHFVDPIRGSSFAVPAFDTTYGVAFSVDGRYAYLASHRHGTIARVDLVKQRIDKRVAGPPLVQRLIVSPHGTHLFAIGLGRKYTVYDLPTLARRTDLAHAPEVADAADQLFTHGQTSLDDRYLVIPEAMHGDAPGELVIARVLD
jgi:hypothetical protein